MKNLIIAIISLIPLFGNGQAHLGSTLTDIKVLYPQKEFSVEYTDDGSLTAQTDMPYGTFIYFFDKETELSRLCIQLPDNMVALNAQVEIYNRKYVIVSETSWKAYLEGGGIMEIKLTYDEDLKTYVFIYTSN